jgi:hypothetical protein
LTPRFISTSRASSEFIRATSDWPAESIDWREGTEPGFAASSFTPSKKR